MEHQVAQGQTPGGVLAVRRRGKLVCLESFGRLDPAGPEPMTRDAIFRIGSMTKPFSAMAALTLVEEGRLLLSDEVSTFLPALADLRVTTDPRHADRPDVPTVPLHRPMTVRDLMLNTSGIVGGYLGSPGILRVYDAHGIRGFDHRAVAFTETTQDLVERLGGVPLAHQPGSVWEYGLSYEVLGRVLEVVSGQNLDELVDDRVLRPLGMSSTGFWVPEERAHLVAQPDRSLAPDLELLTLTSRPSYLSGGSGCYSTISDYLRFLTCLTGRGTAEDGTKVLSPRFLDMMLSDHLGDLAESGPDFIPGVGYSWGLGVAVRRPRGTGNTPGSPGDYWWLGRGSTLFFVDPAEELDAVLMMQSSWQARWWQGRRYHELFRDLVYQAIVQ
ncbi:serine hydrolase domain-containing protein [Nocardioides campestrisoli]|uniref:serine hydrolase domain-containing protein n=1 Tax=Nocardioides campestrisoli TaxID=2736757 RepID=UPI00163D743D|nr:serine hydrolase domain-containing protein [Nocardioides campestrisoli]